MSGAILVDGLSLLLHAAGAACAARLARSSRQPVGAVLDHDRVDEVLVQVVGVLGEASREARRDRDLIEGRATSVALSVDPEHHYAPRWDRFLTALR